MKKIIFIGFILFFKNLIYAECMKYSKESCFKAILLSSEKENGMRGFSWQEYFRTELVEYGSGLKLILLLKEKADPINGLYINYGRKCEIFLQPFSGPFYDKLYRFDDASICGKQNLKNVEESIVKLKSHKGSYVSDLQKYGLYRIKIEKNIWTYQAPPNITVDVVTDSDACNLEYCFDEERQKITDIVNFRKEFDSNYEPKTDECHLLKNPKNRTSFFSHIKYYFCKK